MHLTPHNARVRGLCEQTLTSQIQDACARRFLDWTPRQNNAIPNPKSIQSTKAPTPPSQPRAHRQQLAISILMFLHAPPPPPPASSSSPASILINVVSLPSSFSHLHRSLATFVVRSIVNVVLRQISIIHLIILSPRLTSLHPTNVRLTRLPLAKDPLDSILRDVQARLVKHSWYDRKQKSMRKLPQHCDRSHHVAL